MVAETITDFERDLMRIFRELKLRVWSTDGDYAFAPTGELYWTVDSGGKHREGDALRYFESERRAHREFDHKVRNLVQTFAGECAEPILYFRHRPEMREVDGLFSVYSRFLLSCKPVIQPAIYDKLYGPNGP